MEISLTEPVRNEVLHRVKEGRNILHTKKQRMADWVGHILSIGISPSKHDIEGKIERNTQGAGRRANRRKQLVIQFRETRIYWN
jgi:hypothetical protein